MTDLRDAIWEERFDQFQCAFLNTYQPTDEAIRQKQKEKWLRAREG
jgi:hypothetical protein